MSSTTQPTFTLLVNVASQSDGEVCDTAFDTLELAEGTTRDEAVAQAEAFAKQVLRDVSGDKYAGHTVDVSVFLHTLEPGDESDDGGEEVFEIEHTFEAEDATKEEAQAALDKLGQDYVVIGEDTANGGRIRLGQRIENGVFGLGLWFDNHADIIAWAQDDENHVDRENTPDGDEGDFEDTEAA